MSVERSCSHDGRPGDVSPGGRRSGAVKGVEHPRAMRAERPGQEIDDLLAAIPEGWTRVEIDGQPWSISRTTRSAGRVVSVAGEHLGTSHAVCANIWAMSDRTTLRPCEVPEEDVRHLLRSAAEALEPQDRDGR